MKHLIACLLALFALLACSGSFPANPVVDVPSVSSGGSTAATTVVENSTGPEFVEFPVCNPAQGTQPKSTRKVSGWKKSKAPMKARVKASYSIEAGDSFNKPNFNDALDQWVGSCTGHTLAHSLSTWPFTLRLDDLDAMAIYSLATKIDFFSGTFPPDDCGSDGASAALAAKQLGYTTVNFGAVYDIETLALALEQGTCAFGTDWYEGFSNPTRCGEATLDGVIEGGHEVLFVGYEKKRKIFWYRNSWGPKYGVRRRAGDNGYAYWSAGTVQKLLRDGAAIDCPIF